jgi:hypothetical protein
LFTRFWGRFDREPASGGATCDLDDPARGRAPVGQFDPSNTRCREPRLQQLVVAGSGEAVPAGAEVVAAGAKGSEERLRMRRRREPLEHPFAAAGQPVRMLGSIVQAFVPPVLDPRQHAS